MSATNHDVGLGPEHDDIARTSFTDIMLQQPLLFLMAATPPRVLQPQ